MCSILLTDWSFSLVVNIALILPVGLITGSSNRWHCLQGTAADVRLAGLALLPRLHLPTEL